MCNKIVALDIETPNRYHNRICSMGLSIIVDGIIVNTRHYFINPETEFDPANINIHGIQPADVREAPTFPNVWGEISELISSCIIVAHNATFDLCVLRKTLQAYRIFESVIQYACTLEIARNNLTNLENYRLPTLCRYAGIELHHHDAESDSLGCAKLLCNLLDSGIQLASYVRPFDLTLEIEQKPHHTKYLSNEHLSLNALRDILAAITCDNVLKEEEILFLQTWLDSNQSLKGHYPYDQIYDVVLCALLDGVLEQQELDQMLRLFKQIADPVSCLCFNNETLDIKGKTIVLTGDFDRGERKSIQIELALLGAICKNSVTRNTDYVVVGGQGSTAWYAGNYGTKVKKALELQGRGLPIQIIRESEFYSALGRD